MTKKPEFYGTSPDEQVERLAELTRAALPQWGITDADVEQIAYRENMTFRVSSGGRSYAFRVHQFGYRTDAQIQSELDIMRYLNGEGISTPVVVPTENGALFTTVETEGVGEPRQCDMFEWIEGKAMRETGQGVPVPEAELVAFYEKVGGMAADIYNALEQWDKPPGFERPAWDAEGMFGVNAHLGDFRKLTDVTDEQRQLLLDIAAEADRRLAAFGQTPDRYGLSHGDFLAENIFICDDGMRLLDFDDAGNSWYLLDLTTAVFDMLEMGPYEACLEAILKGYRQARDLPDEHLELIPAFLMARILSYLGWCAKKTHMPQTAWMKPVLLFAAEKHGPEFLRTGKV